MRKQENIFCFRLQLRIKLVASEFCFRFHITALCFMKNAFASGSSKSQMLPSLLSASFKVLPFPQKFNRFQFPLPHPWFYSILILLCEKATGIEVNQLV